MARISVETLYAQYGAYLRAKVQLVEFANWGNTTTDGMRRVISEYEATEAAFVAQMLEDRKKATEAFKEASGL